MGPTVDADTLRDIRRDLLVKLPPCGGWPQPGYVIDSDETDDHVTHDYVFCWEHAQIVARGDSILTGHEMFPVNVSGGATGHEENCAFYGCGVDLNTGSPTDSWIDSALGLTESDPYAIHVTPYQLVRSECNMVAGDKRWPVWIRQANRVIRQLKRKAAGRG